MPSLRVVRPSVPETVEQAITRAIAPVAADRFTSAGEFARALATDHCHAGGHAHRRLGGC